MESFFTPWHLVLYSAFAALVGWLVWLGRRHGDGQFTLPVGYPLGALGAAVFAVGGAADLGWHQAFGIEAGIDALVSPSHLVLFGGGMLILTSPLRSAWWGRGEPTRGPGTVDRLPGTAALILATALAAFFLSYASVFTAADASQPLAVIAEGQVGHEASETPLALGLARYLTTTALVVIPLLLLYRRAPISFGPTTALVTVVAWLSAGLIDLPATAVGTAIAVTVAAAATDAVLAGLDQRSRLPRRARLVLAGALLPAALWPAQLTALAVTDRIGWPVELWSGVTILTVFAGAALGLLCQPFRAPSAFDGVEASSGLDTDCHTGGRAAPAVAD